MATLAEREAEVKTLKVQLVEAKASGGVLSPVGDRSAAAIAARLEAAVVAHATIAGIVEREKTIKGLWVEATPAYRRAQTQVGALTAQMEMLGTGR